MIVSSYRYLLCKIQMHYTSTYQEDKKSAILFACFSFVFTQTNLHVSFIHNPHACSIANNTLWLMYKLTCCIVLIASVHYSWCIHCCVHPYISFITPFKCQKHFSCSIQSHLNSASLYTLVYPIDLAAQ